MKFIFALFGSALFFIVSHAQERAPLSFEEVFSVIRTNLPDTSEEELSRAAALGLIKELGTKVQLVTNNASAPQSSDEIVSRRATYGGSYGYIQIRSVGERLPSELQKWLNESSNSFKGLVLDLRYSNGDNYAAAAALVDLFVKGGEPLLKLGGKEIVSTDKAKPIDLPVAALINGETRGAAEALAALVRTTGTGLVIGSPSAGQARLFETFTLKSGQRLKIGTVPVLIGDKPISAKGLTPDLPVEVNPGAEKIFFQDPFRTINPFTGQVAPAATNEVASATNRARRFNEAELVRRHRSGASPDELPLATTEPPDQPVINDPVLARALDFLKGISALQQHRPQ